MQTPPLLQRTAIGVHQRRKVFEMRNEYTLVDETGQPIGSANQERQGWMTFLIRLFGANGTEVADVTKQWRGLFTETFTDADSYAVEFSPTVTEPLRTLSFAAALAVDLVTKQKDRG